MISYQNRGSIPTAALLTLVFLVNFVAQLSSVARAETGAERALPPAGWLSPAWSHRMLVTANESALDESATLTSFPLVLDGTVIGPVFLRARTDGLDIVVTSRALELIAIEGDEGAYYVRMARTVVDLFLNGMSTVRMDSAGDTG